MFYQGSQINLPVPMVLGNRINWHSQQDPWVRMMTDSPDKWYILQKGFMENIWQDPKWGKE